MTLPAHKITNPSPKKNAPSPGQAGKLRHPPAVPGAPRAQRGHRAPRAPSSPSEHPRGVGARGWRWGE